MFFPLLVMPSLLLCQLESFHLFKAKLKFHPPWCFSRLLQAESILLIPMLHNMTLTPFDELPCWIIKLCMSFFFIAAWATRHELCLVFSTRLLSTHSVSVSVGSWILKYKQGCPRVVHSVVGGQLRKKSTILKQCGHVFIEVFMDWYGSSEHMGRGCLYLRRFLGKKDSRGGQSLASYIKDECFSTKWKSLMNLVNFKKFSVTAD